MLAVTPTGEPVRDSAGQCPEPTKRGVKVGDQIGRVLQTDLQPDDRPGHRASGDRAIAVRIDRQRKAFEPTPAVADPEQRQSVDQCRPRRIVAAVEDEREQA